MDFQHAFMDLFGEQIHDDSEVQSRDADLLSSILEMDEDSQVESEYEAWCATDGLNADDYTGDIEEPTVSSFMPKTFDTWDIDLLDFPGLNHASAYISGCNVVNDSHYQNLEKDNQESVRGLLTEKYANDRMAGHFEIGKVVGDRFTIMFQFSGAYGCFNRGIYLVEDKLDISGQRNAILKLLPMVAVNPGYAEREISSLAKLNHRNIVCMANLDESG
jgi:hypothetical protein